MLTQEEQIEIQKSITEGSPVTLYYCGHLSNKITEVVASKYRQPENQPLVEYDTNHFGYVAEDQLCYSYIKARVQCLETLANHLYQGLYMYNAMRDARAQDAEEYFLSRSDDHISRFLDSGARLSKDELEKIFLNNVLGQRPNGGK